jgi:hypothetical protein
VAYLPIRSSVDLQRLIIGTTREDHWLDFKAALGGDNPENARDVAQFGNAEGGTLVFGAEEAGHVLTKFTKVPDPPKVIARIEAIVTGHLIPVPVIEPHALEVSPGSYIVAVNVPPSVVLIALHDQQRQFEFVSRGHESKRWMTLIEVEARMQNQERAMRLRLAGIPATSPVGLDAWIRQIGHNDWRVTGVSDDVVRLTKDGEELVAPLAYIEAVYQAGEPSAEWIVRLPCYIAKHSRTQRLHLTRMLPQGMHPGKFSTRGLD